MWWTVVGLVAVIGAVGLIAWKVTELKLGELTSRFVGAVAALIAYYYVAYYYLGGLGYTFWIAQLVVPLLLGLTAAYFLYLAIKSREEEFSHLLGSSGWLVAAAGLLVVARYLFSL